MKKIFNLLFIAAAVSLGGCGDSFYNVYDDIAGPVQSVVITPTLSVVVTETAQLYATVYPSMTPNKNVTWSSSNSVVSVDPNTGVVTGNTVNQTSVVTATTEDGGFTAECVVTVVPVPKAIDSITLPLTYSLGLGLQYTFSPVILPLDATNKELTWTSSDYSKVTVTSAGLIEGVGTGIAMITATSNRWGKSSSCLVTVGAANTVVNIAAISGVAAPVAGATPVTAITPNSQYIGTVAWSGSPVTFAGSTVYTATITLTALTGYTLTGVAADFFTVAGATTDTNPAGSGIVTVVFPVSNNITSATLGTLNYVQTGGGFQRDATPANKSTESFFYMSAHEITQAQYMAVTGHANPSFFTGDTSRPVEQVTWYDAVEFCNNLSTNEGLTPVYSITARVPAGTAHPITGATVTATWTNNGYRLPTDMEWMYAAMGCMSDSRPGAISGGVNINGYSKPFAGSNGSNAVGDYAWYSVNSSNTTHPVGTRLPNELGLYDMSGNVIEWCWDKWDGFAAYPSGLQADYYSISGTDRVMHGGCYSFAAAQVTFIPRGSYPPGERTRELGFRVVRN